MTFFRKIKKLIKITAVLAPLLLFIQVPEVTAADIALKQMGQAIDDLDKSAQEDKDWTQDLDKKLDTTIKVLNVIKEELKEEKKAQGEDAKAQAKTTLEEKVGTKVGRWAGKLNRIWRKLRRATAPEEEKLQVESEPDLIDDKEISSKLGQAIDMMSAIKAELDKEEKIQK